MVKKAIKSVLTLPPIGSSHQDQFVRSSNDHQCDHLSSPHHDPLSCIDGWGSSDD